MPRRVMTAFVAFAAAIAWLPTVNAAAQQQPASLARGDHTLSIEHDGRRRSYLLHVPATTGRPLPVVLAFHGGGGGAEGYKAYAGLDVLADRHGFIVAYPNGSGLLPRRPVMEGLEKWRADDGCATRPRETAIRSGRHGTTTELATLIVWDDCTRNATVAHWQLTSVGHGWPGTIRTPVGEEVIGPPTTIISAAEKVWKFFAQVTR